MQPDRNRPANARVARPEEWVAALSLLFGYLPADERNAQVKDLLGQVARGELSLAGLVIGFDAAADDDGSQSLRGVMLTVLQKDGTAMMFPPVLVELQDRGVAEALLRATTGWFQSTSGKLAQCLVDVEDELFSDVLVTQGYPHLAELSFMKRELDDLPDFSLGELEFVTYREETHDEFVRTLGETYIDSRDCPALSSVRSPEDALAGHREAGKFLPEHWYLYRLQGVNVGLMLLTEHADAGLWELIYIGIRPGFRGRGYARTMLIQALHAALIAKGLALTLAVDAANEPAVRVYEQLGFYEVLRKHAHLRWKV